MARNALPLAASLLFALTGLPAAAAEIGDEGNAVDAPDSSELDPVDDAATQAEDGERAARRGGGRSGGNRATANRGGGRSGGQPAAKGQGGRGAPSPQSTAAAPGRAPAASGHAAPAQAGAHRGQTAQRPSTPAAQAPSTSPQRSVSGMPRGGEAPRAQANAASAQRGQGSQAHRPGNDGRGQGSQAHRPGGDGRGSNATQAHNGPRAANAVPGHRGGNHARPGHARPGNAHKHVVHHSAWRPSRWAPTWHRYHLRGVPHYAPRYWAAGVFYYNPPPRGHRVVVVDDHGKRMQDATGPQRAVNRNNTVSVGIQGGSYMSGYRDGGGYGDLGLGVELGYRPAEAIGLELSWTHHSDTWDDHAERAQDPLSASVALYAFPWTRVSPHLDLGLTATPRATVDTYSNGMEQVSYEGHDALFGPHIGAGIEFAVGKSAALDFSGKYIGYIDVQEDDRALPGAFQGNMGLKFYF